MKQKFSFYNYCFSHNKKNFLYNILSTSLVEVDDKILYAFKQNDVSLVPLEYMAAMRQEGFIVDFNIDEKLIYKEYFDYARFSSQGLMINFIPSYNCNLACPYCIQGHNKSCKKMSISEVSAVIKFAEQQILESKGRIKGIFPFLYGGEPMLSKQELIFFCSEIKRISDLHGIKPNYTMTSNMTLFDDSMLDMMREYQIHVQVSIDGLKEEHDKRRIYKNGQGTYDIIINNLKKLCAAGLKHLITIRLNIDKDNLKHAEEIFNSVKEYSDDVYFGYLREYSDLNANYKNDCIAVDKYYDITTEVFDEILKKNNRLLYPSLGKKSPCSINSENKFFIDPYLNVYKCDMLLNQPECRAGTLDLDGNFHKEAGYYQQMSFSPFEFEKCRNCKYLPICGGGCPGKKYGDRKAKDGNIMFYDCTHNEKILLTYLKNYVDRHEEE